MSADPNKKSGRSFQCRDVLWETFEQMARELECSVDYLINEAMKQYARQRSYGGASRTPPPVQGGGPLVPSSGFPSNLPPPPVGAPQGMGPMRGGGPMPIPSSRLPPPPVRSNNSPSSPPMRMAPAATPAPAPQRPPGQSGRNTSPPPSRVPPPMQRQQTTSAMPAGMAQMPTSNGYSAPVATQGGMLSVIYQGEKLPVTKDRFVIGRGKQSSDLTLKDPNVSRQHAMVEFQNGVYYMVDMGSTNGVEFNGQRIARKQIGEGDAFRICDHEMRFTYR